MSRSQLMRGAWLLSLSLIMSVTLSCDFKRPPLPVSGYEFDDTSCSDGIDNDGDGLIDCADTGCLEKSTLCGVYIPLNPVYEEENTFELCRDGQDNDDDGNYDCGDRKCQQIAELCCGREFTNETCSCL